MPNPIEIGLQIQIDDMRLAERNRFGNSNKRRMLRIPVTRDRRFRIDVTEVSDLV